MAIRSEVVRPDSIIGGIDGREILCASRESIVEAVVRAVDTMLLCGGEFTVSSQRAPTGYPHESVCAVAFVRWQNHSAAKPQPEPYVPSEVEQFQQELEDAADAAEAQRENEDDVEADVEDHVPAAH